MPVASSASDKRMQDLNNQMASGLCAGFSPEGAYWDILNLASVLYMAVKGGRCFDNAVWTLSGEEMYR